MGAGASNVLHAGHLRRPVFRFAQWPLAEVKQLLGRLRSVGQLSLTEAHFCAWLCQAVPDLGEREVLALFDLLDAEKKGTVNGLEFIAGVVMLCDDDFANKTQFCFELYDFNLNGALCMSELVIMVSSTVLGILKLIELDPSRVGEAKELESVALFEEVAKRAIWNYDRDTSRSLSYEEFVNWAHGNREVKTFVETIDVFSRAAAQEARERKLAQELAQRARIEDAAAAEGDEAVPLPEDDWEGQQPESTSAAPHQNAGAVYRVEAANCGPSNSLFEGHLELEWVYGYSGRSGQNAVKYLDERRERVVYPAGSSAVILERDARRQIVYSGHAAPICALEVHRNGRTIASADTNGEVHVWDWRQQGAAGEPDYRPKARAILQAAPSAVRISFDRTRGQLLAVASSKADPVKGRSTYIDVWDWASRQRVAEPLRISAEAVTGLQWATDADLLAACGPGFLKFYAFDAPDAYTSRFLSDQRSGGKGDTAVSRGVRAADASFATGQTAPNLTSLAFLGKNLIAGSATGELLMFDCRSHRLERVVRAHAENEPVRCLTEWARGLVSAADDGEVRLWDLGLHPLEAARPSRRAQNAQPVHTGNKKTNRVLLVSGKDQLSLVDARIASVAVARASSSRIALVGMASGQIFEVDLDERTGTQHRTKKVVVEGHAGGTTSGLAVHPAGRTVFATCSESDATVRLWDSVQHRQFAGCVLGAPASCLAFSPCGTFLAVGMADGRVSVRDPSSNATLRKELLSILSPEFAAGKPGESSPGRGVLALRFSPSGAYLAVTCYSGATYLFVVRRQTQLKHKAFTCVKVLKASNTRALFGPTVAGASLDWSRDGAVLRIALVGGTDAEPLRKHYFWNIHDGGNRIEDTLLSLKELQWATSAAPELWRVAGMPKTVREAATCFDAHDGLLALGDRRGNIALTRYPCTEPLPSSQLKLYAMERSRRPVRGLRFVGGHAALLAISSSRTDGHFVQWRVVHDDEAGCDMDAQAQVVPSDDDNDSEIEEEILAQRGLSAPRWDAKDSAWSLHDGEAAKPSSAWERRYAAPSPEEEARRAAVRDLMGVSDAKYDADLKLAWVSGLTTCAQKARPNVRYLAERQLAYPAAGLVVVANLATKDGRAQQRFFQRHPGQVDAIGVAPLRAYAASAQGTDLFVWEAATLNSVAHVRLPWAEGAAHIAFSPEEDLLCVVGKDGNQSVAIFDWRKERLKGLSPGGAKTILDLVWVAPREFVCVGTRHVTFWRCNSSEEGPPESHRGRFAAPKDGPDYKGVAKQNVVSVCLLPQETGDPVVATGLASGAIAFWSCAQRCVVGVLASPGPGMLPYSLCASPVGDGSLVVGRKDGSLALLRRRRAFEPGADANFADAFEPAERIAELGASVRSIDAVRHHAEEGASSSGFGRLAPPVNETSQQIDILVGTRAGHVVEFRTDLVDLTKTQRIVVNEGHAVGEIWGLAAHPSAQLVASGGDDCFVRVWDSTGRRQVAKHQLAAKVKTVAFKNADDGAEGAIGEIAAGLISGKVVALRLVRAAAPEADLSHELTSVAELSEPTDWVQVLRYSPAGDMLAAGCHDRSIYVYSSAGSSYALLHKLEGHTSFVSDLDWSVPGDRMSLQSTSGRDGTELLHWDATTGARINSARALRDVEWASWTCLRGWAVSGIDDADMACCARSTGQLTLAAGRKDGSIVFYPFPLPEKTRKMFKRVKAHAGEVTRLVFSADDRFVASSSVDGCLCWWTTEHMEDICRAREAWLATPVDQREHKVKARLDDLGAAAQPRTDPSSSRFHAPVVAEAKAELGMDTDAPAVPWPVDDQAWRKLTNGALAKRWALQAHSAHSQAPRLDLEWVYGRSAVTGAHYVNGRDDVLVTAANLAVVYKPIRNGRVARQGFFAQHASLIKVVAVSADGLVAATSDAAGVTHVWDPRTLVVKCTVRPQGGARVASLCFSPGAKYLGVVDTGGAFFLRDAATGECLASTREEAGCPSIQRMLVLPRNEGAPDSLVDVFTAGGQFLRMWTFEPARTRLSSKSPKSPIDSDISCLAHLSNYVITGHADGSLVFWSRDTVTARRVLGRSDLHPERVPGAPHSRAGGVRQVMPTPDGRLLCLFENGVTLAVDTYFEAHPSDSFVANPNVTMLSACSAAGRWKCLQSLSTGALLELEGLRDPPRVVPCGHATEVPDAPLRSDPLQGRLVACTLRDHVRQYCVTAGRSLVHLWDLEGHKLLRTEALPDEASSIAASPSGQQVVVGTKGGTIEVFAGDLSRRIKHCVISYSQTGDHSRDAVRSLAFSPDGAQLAVGSDDAHIRVLETRDFALIRIITAAHTAPVTHLDWSLDGRCLRSNACLHVVPVADLLALVPRPAVDELSETELEPGSTAEDAWATTSCPLAEHALELWSDGRVLVSSATAARGLALVQADGQVVSARGTPLAAARHQGAAKVHALDGAPFLLSAGLYDGLLFQFRL